MTEVHSCKDGATGCYANVRMDNGDPCFISVAQTGILVKKSKSGMFGPILYDNKNAYDAAMAAIALQFLYPKKRTPSEITNPILNAVLNAVLHCSSIAEVTLVLNEAVKDAEENSGQNIGDLATMPM